MSIVDGFEGFREERELAQARGEYEAARALLAVGEGGDAVIARLDGLRRSIAPDLFPGEQRATDDGPPVALTAARVALATEIDRTLSVHAERETTAAQRHAAARRRYEAAALHLVPSAELDRLEERVADTMAVLPGRLDEALNRFEAALARRIARDGEGGVLVALRRLTLARLLALRGDTDRANRLVDEAERVLADSCGAGHPVALVAEGRRILIALGPVESRPGVGFASAEERASLEMLLPAAKRLAAARTALFGEHASATIKAFGYVSRIEFACGRPAAARDWAHRAVIAGSAAPSGDLALPIVTVVLAQTLALSADPERARRARELADGVRGVLASSAAGAPWLTRLAGLDELHAQAVARGRRRA